jgi:hypothetical protein
MYGVIAQEWFLTLYTEGALVRVSPPWDNAEPGPAQLCLPGLTAGSAAPGKSLGAPRYFVPGVRRPDGTWEARALCLVCTRSAVLFLRANDVPIADGYAWV